MIFVSFIFLLVFHFIIFILRTQHTFPLITYLHLSSICFKRGSMEQRNHLLIKDQNIHIWHQVLLLVHWDCILVSQINHVFYSRFFDGLFIRWCSSKRHLLAHLSPMYLPILFVKLSICHQVCGLHVFLK